MSVATRLPVARIKIGDSIAVNGACLTVIAKRADAISMDVSAETFRRTALGELKTGDRVNLERCLTLGTLLNGHLVSGHVDGVGRIVSIEPEGDSFLYTFEAAPSEVRYMIEKGSAAIDGISLTVFGIRGRRFNVEIVPHTARMTTLGVKRPGAKVNIENDMLGKYIEKFIAARSATELAASR